MAKHIKKGKVLTQGEDELMMVFVRDDSEENR